MTDDQLFALLKAEGYLRPRRLPNGCVACLMVMNFTTWLYMDVALDGWRTRYCYENLTDALDALESWDGAGDPPGPWIKQKPEERLGPGAVGKP